MWHVSANRDEEVFPDPFTFDIERQANEHISFGGGGAHFCLGANLAKLELEIIFTEIVRAHARPRPGGRAGVPALELHLGHQADAGDLHPGTPQEPADGRRLSGLNNEPMREVPSNHAH